MRVLTAVAIAVLAAGCADAPPEKDDAGTVHDAHDGTPVCADPLEVARSKLAVILANVTGGLGPHGAIQPPWANGTVEVLQDGRPIAEVALDRHGCGTYQPPALGSFVFRAKPTDGSCSLDGNATIVQTADAGHVVWLALSFPCA